MLVVSKFRLLLFFFKYHACRMSSSRDPGGPSYAAAAHDDFGFESAWSANNFSKLLWMPHDQHKVSRIHDDVSYSMNHIKKKIYRMI